jgi:8-amino-7-oxononanoate synthase
MDGDLAPLHELSGLCRKHRACLVVDDAHGFGVLGNNGLGGLDHFSLDQSAVPLLMATFGKALGTYGAFIAGPAALIETLVQRARTYIYTTSLPAPLAAAAHEALKVHEDEPERRDHLASRIRRFRSGVRQLGIKTTSAETPIQPVIIGDSKKTQLASRMLEQNGLFISAIRPPTVPRNSSRLRITLSAGHTDEQIDRLLDGLNKCIAIGLI